VDRHVEQQRLRERVEKARVRYAVRDVELARQRRERPELGHGVAEGDELGHVAPVLADHEEPAGAVGGLDHRVRLRERGRQRLLAQHVESLLERRDRDVVVGRRRRHVDEEVGALLGEHLLERRARGQPVQPEIVGRRAGTLGVDVDHADELGVGALDQLPAPVRAEQADAREQASQRRGHVCCPAHRTALASTRRMSGWW
jgi:hypothetical protein